MPGTVEPLAGQLAQGEGSLLVGDIGLLVLKALLENGVGYLVTGWIDRANPIDAAIADVQHSVLPRHGVLLRRSAKFSHIEQVLREPTGGLAAQHGAPRGAVVWHGRSGLCPALERFCAIECPGPVVGLCFDADALRSDDVVALEPESTPDGLVRTIDQAFALSHAIGRPVLVVVRERLLDVRGAIRCRDNLRPEAAAALESGIGRGHQPADAVAALGLDRLPLREGVAAIVCGQPVARSVERAVGALVAACGELAFAITVVGISVPAVVGDGSIDAACGDGPVLVLDDVGWRLARRLERAGVAGERVTRRELSYQVATGRQVVATVASWLASLDLVPRHMLAVAADAVVGATEIPARKQVPRRNASLHRELSPQIAAALVIAQATIGVPARVHDQYPTYQTETGVALTVVPSHIFAQHGPESAAPGTQPGVFLVTGAITADVQAAATACGGTVEAVDAGRPRAVAVSVARACASPRTHAHVIVLAPAVATVRTDCDVGADPELVGGDHLACAAFPQGAVAVVGSTDELTGGVTLAVHDADGVRMGVDATAELSAAWYELRVRRLGDAFARAHWTLTRRMLRSIAKVET